jgi:hypothetical protein
MSGQGEWGGWPTFASRNFPRSFGNSVQMVDQNIGIEEFAHRSHSLRSFS